MNRSLVFGSIVAWSWAVAGASCLADSRAEIASRAWAVTETVLSRHVDPPTRQEMIVAAIRAIASPEETRAVNRLALRVSNLTNSEQFEALLGEVWGNSPVKDEEARERALFNGLLSVVPGRGFLLSSKERKVTESMEANLYVGVQVAISIDEKSKKPVFQQILEGGPADLAGIKAGDLIEEVDGAPTEGMPMTRMIDRLRGAEGTTVVVKYSRPSTKEVTTASLKRGRLPRASVEGLAKGPEKRWKFRLDEGSPIGYVKVKEIMGSTPRELRAFAGQLEAEGMKALILDLREVRSAGFHPTVLLADALLDGGVIGRVASSEGERTIKAEPDALFRGWPIVVLTTDVSIGEVAWLADALEANKRASVIGGHLVAGEDAVVREIVALSGSDWSIQMPTGRLERGDGKPLAAVAKPRRMNVVPLDAEDLDPSGDSRANLAPNEKDTADSPTNGLQQMLRKYTVQPSLTAGVQGVASGQVMQKARAILEEALRSAGK